MLRVGYEKARLFTEAGISSPRLNAEHMSTSRVTVVGSVILCARFLPNDIC